MHPREQPDDDDEQQHEAARPQAGQVVERAEGDRQDEAAEAADHADEAADRADVVGVVGRDVLVDGGLAEAHEEAEHEGDDDEGGRADLEMEGDLALDAVHDVVGRRQRQDQRRRGRDEQAPVHHGARADAVGQHAAIGAEDAGGNGIGAPIMPAVAMSKP